MSLLQYKKKRNRLSGEFTYTIKNAVVFNRARNRWLLRVPAEILKVSALCIGRRVDVRVEGKALVIAKPSASKEYTLRQRVRVRIIQPHGLRR